MTNFAQLDLKDWPQRVLFPLTVVAAVLGLAYYFGQSASILVVGALIAVPALLVLMLRPQLGLPALMIADLVVPFAIATGTQTVVNITILLLPLLLALWIIEMLRHHHVEWLSSRVNVPLFLFCVSATVSLAAGIVPWNPFAHTAPFATQLAGWAVFILSAGAFWLLANRIQTEHQLKVLVGVFLVMSTPYILSRLTPWQGLQGVLITYGADGSVFWTWITALSLGQLLFNQKLRPWPRFYLIFLLGVSFVACYFFNRLWTSGWVPMAITIGALIWLRSWRVGLLVTVIALGVLLYTSPDFFAALLGAKQYSTDTRLEAWRVVVTQVIPNSPIIGLGPANYYFYTQLYGILGYAVSFNSHNQYVDIMAEMGIVGLGLYVWLQLQLGSLAWSLRNRFKGDFMQGYVFACLGAMVGMAEGGMQNDWILPFAYNIGLNGFRASVLAWLFLGGLVFIENQAKQRAGAKDSVPAS
ncbi:MAG: O-antigen ligase family protein [Anaerolineae bacterium]